MSDCGRGERPAQCPEWGVQRWPGYSGRDGRMRHPVPRAHVHTCMQRCISGIRAQAAASLNDRPARLVQSPGCSPRGCRAPAPASFELSVRLSLGLLTGSPGALTESLVFSYLHQRKEVGEYGKHKDLTKPSVGTQIFSITSYTFPLYT